MSLIYSSFFNPSFNFYGNDISNFSKKRKRLRMLFLLKDKTGTQLYDANVVLESGTEDLSRLELALR